MAGNENSGPRIKLPNLKREMSGMFSRNYRQIYQTIIDKAMAGNLEAAIYCIDRELGRPRQEIDARVRSTLSFTPDQLMLMSRTIVLDSPTETNTPLSIESTTPVLEGEAREIPPADNDNANNVCALDGEDGQPVDTEADSEVCIQHDDNITIVQPQINTT